MTSKKKKWDNLIEELGWQGTRAELVQFVSGVVGHMPTTVRAAMKSHYLEGDEDFEVSSKYYHALVQGRAMLKSILSLFNYPEELIKLLDLAGYSTTETPPPPQYIYWR